MKNVKRIGALLLALMLVFSLAACGSKDALAGTWTGDLGLDGIVTWTFNGSGKCTMENEFMKQSGSYTIDGDQVAITLENWDDAVVFTFAVEGSSLTMNDNEGIAISGTYTKQ